MVDAVDKRKFRPDAVERPGFSHESALDDLMQMRNRSNTERRVGVAPYLGLQIVVATTRGLDCLLQRVPKLGYSGDRFSVDSLAVRANCPGRFALRDGHNEAINWPNPRLVAWHTTSWVQRLQAKVYREWTPEWFCGRGYGDRIG